MHPWGFWKKVLSFLGVCALASFTRDSKCMDHCFFRWQCYFLFMNPEGLPAVFVEDSNLLDSCEEKKVNCTHRIKVWYMFIPIHLPWILKINSMHIPSGKMMAQLPCIGLSCSLAKPPFGGVYTIYFHYGVYARKIYHTLILAPWCSMLQSVSWFSPRMPVITSSPRLSCFKDPDMS